MRKSILLTLLILICFTCAEMRAEKSAAGNINYLPGNEIIGVNSQIGQLYDFYRDRTLVTNFPVRLPENEIFYSSPVLANINNDPYDEILVLSKDDDDNYFYHCFNSIGQEDGRFSGSLDFIPNKDFVIEDIDNDTRPDIIFGDYDGNLKAYNLQTHELLADLVISSGRLVSPVVFDVNRDDINEIVALSGDGRIQTYKFNFPGWVDYCPAVILNEETINAPVIYKENESVKMAVATIKGKVFLFEMSGGQWVLSPGSPVDTGEDILISPAVGDFDNNNEKEIAVLSAMNKLYILDSNGEIQINYFKLSPEAKAMADMYFFEGMSYYYNFAFFNENCRKVSTFLQ